MATIVIRRRSTKGECIVMAALVEQWFTDHPRRRVCYTEYYKVRRGHVLEDILSKEKPTK